MSVLPAVVNVIGISAALCGSYVTAGQAFRLYLQTWKTDLQHLIRALLTLLPGAPEL